MLNCYYAHCLALYGTAQERRDVDLLRALGFAVFNPNNPSTQQRAEMARAMGEDVMTFVFKPYVEHADVLAFRALPDGSIPAGVATEIAWAVAAGRPVIELPNGLTRRVLDVERTREYLRDVGQR